MNKFFRAIWTGVKTLLFIVFIPIIIPVMYGMFNYGEKHDWFDEQD